MLKRIGLAGPLAALLLAILACATGTSQPGPSDRATSAALTVQAVLTQSAPTGTAVRQPTSTATQQTQPDHPSPTHPTDTPTPPLPPPPPATTPAICTGRDDSDFVKDMTIPDGSSFPPNAAFTKTWRIKNTGECVWGPGYLFVHIEGPVVGAPESVPLPSSVAPGQEVDISVNFVAPAAGGSYKSRWQLQRPDGLRFGTRPFLDILVKP